MHAPASTPPGWAPRPRRDAAVAVALALAAHAAVLSGLGAARGLGTAAPSASAAARDAAPRVTWLVLRPTEGSRAGAPAAAPRPALGPVVREPALVAKYPAPARAQAVAPLQGAALTASMQPAAIEPVPSASSAPLPVTGIAIGALPGSWAALPMGSARAAWGAPARPPGPTAVPMAKPPLAVAPPGGHDGRSAMREQVVAALLRELAAVGGEVAPGQHGLCRVDDEERLECDHVAARQAMGPAAAALAALLRQLSSTAAPPEEAVLAYAEGRFALELRGRAAHGRP